MYANFTKRQKGLVINPNEAVANTRASVLSTWEAAVSFGPGSSPTPTVTIRQINTTTQSMSGYPNGSVQSEVANFIVEYIY